jgi:predicted peroxiredoxin
MPSTPATPTLLLLAHATTWDRRFQVSSLAASAAASGVRVNLALFFGALDAWVRGTWDTLDPAPPVDPSKLEALDPPRLSRMIETARETGALRLYACSASMRFLGLPAADVQAKVDVIAGWQTFSKLALEARQVVTL